MEIKADIESYLVESEIVDFSANNIQMLSVKLRNESIDDIDLIKNSFEFVRDKIGHSADIGGTIVTSKASDVLLYREGICYAKSHLLAALLRANKIPCGFCYQRLILDDIEAPYLILHGLNAVYLSEIGKWIRIDARGNKLGVDSQFSLDREQLAFDVREELGEEDISTIFDKPDVNVLDSLNKHKTVRELFDDLPRDLTNRYLQQVGDE